MVENEAIEKLKNMRLFMQIEDKSNDCKFTEDDYKANKIAIQALEKQISKKVKIAEREFRLNGIVLLAENYCVTMATKIPTLNIVNIAVKS